MDALWRMPIPVPVSLLLRQGNHAWSCGQLSLGADGQVLHPDDLAAQSRQVCDYVEEILDRADLPIGTIRRALLYYLHRSDEARDEMVAIFRTRLGTEVILDPVPLPHFYYDGVALEVGVFCGMATTGRETGVDDHGPVSLQTDGETAWARVEARPDALGSALDRLDATLEANDLDPTRCLSEHWFAPTGALEPVADQLAAAGWGCDRFVVDVGPSADTVSGVLVIVRSTVADRATEREPTTGVVTTVRRIGGLTWLHGRCIDPEADLVQQTRRIMARFGHQLDGLGLGFDDVAKCTAHYVGGPTPDDLHANMTVRNSHYTRPGPASTGLPVFGFSDPRSAIAIDLTVTSV